MLEIVPPVEFDVPTIRDIFAQEGNYFESEKVGCDPGDSVYERYLYNSTVLDTSYGKATPEIESGEKFMRLYWNNKKQTNSFHIPIWRGHINGTLDPTEGRRVHLSYMIRVAGNFTRAMATSGKFPGFSSAGKPLGVIRNWFGEPGCEPQRGNKRGGLWAGNGGGKVHGYDGWSARGCYEVKVAGAEHPATGCVPIFTYAYYLRQGNELWHEIFKRYEAENGIPPGSGYTVKRNLSQYLQPGETIRAGVGGTGGTFLWDYGAPSGLLWPDRWHRVDQIIRINDPTEANGELDAYIDGRQVARQRGIQWRSHEPKYPKDSTLGVANCWFNFYQGGTQEYKSMTEETHLDLKRVAVRVLEWDE
jgi:hypothetical protein